MKQVHVRSDRFLLVSIVACAFVVLASLALVVFSDLDGLSTLLRLFIAVAFLYYGALLMLIWRQRRREQRLEHG